MIHELKILPEYYCRVADGSKTFEVRVNDRHFNMGDTVVLREWYENYDPSLCGYVNSPPLTFRIGYVYYLDEATVIFSLLPIPKPAFDPSLDESGDAEVARRVMETHKETLKKLKDDAE